MNRWNLANPARSRQATDAAILFLAFHFPNDRLSCYLTSEFFEDFGLQDRLITINSDSMNHWRCFVLFALALVTCISGCSARHYKKSADKEAYRVIRSKSALVTNMDPAFTIEQTNSFPLTDLPVSTNTPNFLGTEGEREINARVLSLEDALLLAVRSSRRYQTEKENLYISALGLTLARHNYAPIFSASAEVAHEVDYLTGPEAPVRDDTITNLFTVNSNGKDRVINSASAGVGVDWLIRDIGRISIDFTVDALRLVLGDSSVATSSRLGGRFTRPLLRNAGFKAEMEALTQAERSLLYDLRSFVQFRKDFAVDIAREYYAVLGERDAARNSYLNMQSSRKNAERSRALAKEGRIRQADLGRLEQQELSAESTWINAVRSYQSALDGFKLALGLSISSNIVLDDHELESLRILDPSVSVEDSIKIALAARMDYLNAKDAYEDSLRKVTLAENFLKPQLDFSAGGSLESDPSTGALIATPDPSRWRWDAGLTVDPGLDRKSERNSYTRAVISRNRAAREIEQVEDTIRLEVRDSWRTLDQAKRNFKNAEIGVRLAERRVEEQDILAELGRANAQDQVDAQNALIDSKNLRTQAIVTHTMARLRFWNRLGILFIKDNGQWEETKDVETASSR